MLSITTFKALLKQTMVVSLRSKEHQNCLTLLVMACTAWFVCHPLLSLAFWGDDAFIMFLAAKYNAFELLFTGGARALNQNTFTPLLGLSYHLDHLLFGNNFLGYNLHSLLLLVCVGFLATLFLRQLEIPQGLAVAGGLTLIITPAMVTVTAANSARHYLFGLGFALLSLLMLLKWRKTDCSRCFWVAVAFYFLALCSKEVYAPLLVVALFFVVPTKATISKTLKAFSAVFILYLLLRWITLGHFIGGYSRGIDWGPMFIYLLKSLPRFLQTVVWGGAAPGEVSGTAVTLGVVILSVTFLLAAKVHGMKGLLCFFGLLVLSLCVVTFTLYVPPVLYGKDPFYCHGERLVLVFSSAIWLSFWYLVSRYLTEKKVSPAIVFLLALIVIAPLTFYGGLAMANNWKKNRATIDQVTFINEHVSEKMLIIGHPTWFLHHYIAMLQIKNPDTLIQVMDRPGRPTIPQLEDFSHAGFIQPEKGILTTHNPVQIKQWASDFKVEYCRLFSDRCPK